MLDCGLSTQTVLNFLPLPLVPSARLNNLPGWMPRDVSDPQLEGVSSAYKSTLDYSLCGNEYTAL
jgi:hypothetical protein